MACSFGAFLQPVSKTRASDSSTQIPLFLGSRYFLAGQSGHRGMNPSTTTTPPYSEEPAVPIALFRLSCPYTHTCGDIKYGGSEFGIRPYPLSMGAFHAQA